MITTAAATSSDALPKPRRDIYPLLLVPALGLAAFPLVGSPSTWVTLTVAGLAMGMIIFVMTSGLTLVFGLMQVFNFGHGVFIALGALLAATLMGRMAWTGSAAVFLNAGALLATILAAMAAAACIGWVFERLIIRPVYGHPLKQILTTLGGLTIGIELLKTIWGVDPIQLQPPTGLQGSFLVAGAVVEKYRLAAAAVGMVVFGIMMWILSSTKIGLLIRAGVQNREMVESMGYPIRRLFIGVFMAGCALAGLGGVLWGHYQQLVNAEIGAGSLVLAIIVIIIGGMGSTGGCLVGALLIGLLDNYVSFLAPKMVSISTILLMVLVLSWRPQGLYPVVKL